MDSLGANKVLLLLLHQQGADSVGHFGHAVSGLWLVNSQKKNPEMRRDAIETCWKPIYTLAPELSFSNTLAVWVWTDSAYGFDFAQGKVSWTDWIRDKVYMESSKSRCCLAVWYDANHAESTCFFACEPVTQWNGLCQDLCRLRAKSDARPAVLWGGALSEPSPDSFQVESTKSFTKKRQQKSAFQSAAWSVRTELNRWCNFWSFDVEETDTQPTSVEVDQHLKRQDGVLIGLKCYGAECDRIQFLGCEKVPTILIVLNHWSLDIWCFHGS